MKWVVKTVVLLAVMGAAVFFFLHKNPEQKQFQADLTLAARADAAAQARVAAAYIAGTTVKKDVSQGVDWYLKSAAQGYAPAAYELAQLYLSGEEIERNIPSGILYLNLAASKDYAPAQYALGRLYQTGAEGLNEQEGQAAFLWLHAAQNGDEDAKAALEQLKADNPDLYDRASALFAQEKKALQKDAVAAVIMGRAYSQGDLLVQDSAQAFAYFQQAAEQKNPQAAYELYQLYMKKDGPIPQDEMKGLEYLQQAAEGGYAPAQYSVGERIYQAAQTAQEREIARQWIDLSAAQNYVPALYMSGILRMQGVGSVTGTQQAIAYFTRAAEMGHADAQYVLGQSYWRGIGVTRNKTKAIEWLTLAQQNGNTQAAALLQQIR